MHVRLCVDCGEEYRPEIAVCADCGGRLEDRHDDGDRTVLPAAKREEIGHRPDAEFTETVGHAKAATDLMEVADRLIEAGLEVRVRPAPEGGYRLLVSAHDLDRALAALGLLVDEKDPPADDAIRSCPACDTRLPAGAVECPECGLVAGDDPEGEPDPD